MLKNRAEKQHCLSENKTDAYLQKEKQQKKLENTDRQRGLLKSRKRLQGSRQVNAAIRKLHKQKITAVKPVSYTHLDVYKRQAYDPASAALWIPSESDSGFL